MIAENITLNCVNQNTAARLVIRGHLSRKRQIEPVQSEGRACSLMARPISWHDFDGGELSYARVDCIFYQRVFASGYPDAGRLRENVSGLDFEGAPKYVLLAGPEEIVRVSEHDLGQRLTAIFAEWDFQPHFCSLSFILFPKVKIALFYKSLAPHLSDEGWRIAGEMTTIILPHAIIVTCKNGAPRYPLHLAQYFSPDALSAPAGVLLVEISPGKLQAAINLPEFHLTEFVSALVEDSCAEIVALTDPNRNSTAVSTFEKCIRQLETPSVLFEAARLTNFQQSNHIIYVNEAKRLPVYFASLVRFVSNALNTNRHRGE